MDNFETHKPGSLYDSFSAEKSKTLWDRFEFIYTPKHGSWLNMAEIELNVFPTSTVYLHNCIISRGLNFSIFTTFTIRNLFSEDNYRKRNCYEKSSETVKE